MSESHTEPTAVKFKCTFLGCPDDGTLRAPEVYLCEHHAQALIYDDGILIWPTVDEIAKLFLTQAVRIARIIQLSDDGLAALTVMNKALANMTAIADEATKLAVSEKSARRTFQDFAR